MRKMEKPVLTAGADKHVDSVETHPAYGVIGANRVTGHTHLFGTDFVHHSYITIRIGQAVLNRSLSRDWPYAPLNEGYIEVALSEAQWATFVSTLNQGQGVPCTVEKVGLMQIPGIDRATAPSRSAQFHTEARETLNDALVKLDEIAAALTDNKGLSAKAREELLGKVAKAKQELTANLDFVADSFGEHTKRNIEHAKIEISAYATGVIQRAGIAALRDGAAPIALPENGDGAEEERS